MGKLDKVSLLGGLRIEENFSIILLYEQGIKEFIAGFLLAHASACVWTRKYILNALGKIACGKRLFGYDSGFR